MSGSLSARSARSEHCIRCGRTPAPAAGLSLPESEAEIVLHTGDRPAETYFLVSSVPEAIERIERTGGRLVAGPVEIGVGLYAKLHDPWKTPLVILDFSKGMLKTDPEGNVTGNQAPDPHTTQDKT